LRFQVRLCQQDSVGHGCLLHGFGLSVQRIRTVRSIDRGDHTIKAIARGNDRVRHQRVQNRCWIRQTRCFNHQTFELWHLPAPTPTDQIPQCLNQIAPDCAAQAAGIHDNHVFARRLYQQIIDPDLAKLIDHDGRLAHRRMLQKPVQHRRLAGAEKPCQHTHWNPFQAGVGAAAVLLRVDHSLSLVNSTEPRVGSEKAMRKKDTPI